MHASLPPLDLIYGRPPCTHTVPEEQWTKHGVVLLCSRTSSLVWVPRKPAVQTNRAWTWLRKKILGKNNYLHVANHMRHAAVISHEYMDVAFVVTNFYKADWRFLIIGQAEASRRRPGAKY